MARGPGRKEVGFDFHGFCSSKCNFKQIDSSEPYFSPSVGNRHSPCKVFVSFGGIIGSRYLPKPLSALKLPGAL